MTIPKSPINIVRRISLSPFQSYVSTSRWLIDCRLPPAG
jgi:hypothetical protein